MKRVIVTGNLFEADITLTEKKSINFCRMIRRHYKKQVDKETIVKVPHGSSIQFFENHSNTMKVEIMDVTC